MLLQTLISCLRFPQTQGLGSESASQAFPSESPPETSESKEGSYWAVAELGSSFC